MKQLMELDHPQVANKKLFKYRFWGKAHLETDCTYAIRARIQNKQAHTQASKQKTVFPLSQKSPFSVTTPAKVTTLLVSSII